MKHLAKLNEAIAITKQANRSLNQIDKLLDAREALEFLTLNLQKLIEKIKEESK